jgi:periplasmic divalent cation tolerance protein
VALRLVYVTTKDKSEALALSRALVERRLAACTNILDRMQSVYLWEGKLETSDECVVIAKTEEAKVDALIAAVKELHSYEVPCALVLPVLGGNGEYLKWVEEALR